MAQEQGKAPAQEGEAAKKKPESATPSKNADSRKWKRAVADYALPAALLVSIVANLAGVFYFRSLALRATSVDTNEIALGDYRFVSEEHEPGQITEAEFALHIELARPAEEPARRLLQARRHKVRQNVEELLRTAHGGDFDDPILRELKSQLQKRINETLGMRAVADVIVTELDLQRARPTKPEEPQSVPSVPWVESTAGG